MLTGVFAACFNAISACKSKNTVQLLAGLPAKAVGLLVVTALVSAGITYSAVKK